MHKTLLRLTALTALAALFFSAGQVRAVSFFRNLKAGDTGEDVLLLQQLLNQDIRTRIAQTGPGSPGFETRTFGQLTRAAVIRFQELHKEEVLLPAGLTRGTGFVGPGTLRKLGLLMQAASGGTAITITNISPSRATPGASAIIHGVGLTQRSTVLFSGASLSAELLAPDLLRFVVPVNATGGLHEVTVRSETGGTSNILKMLIDGPGVATAGAPIITSLSPARGGPGTTITITGSGFATTPTNTIYTGYDKLTGLASADGRTLSFTIPSYLPQFDFSQTDFTGLSEATLPFGVSVENSSGASEAQLFTFIIH